MTLTAAMSSRIVADVSTIGPPTSATLLLKRWREGDMNALEELTRLVYPELKRLAAHNMRRERIGHTLTPTALVAEAYLRLVGDEVLSFENRAHFMSAAARQMRLILVDFARQRSALKRGGGLQRVTFDEQLSFDDHSDLVALDEALTALEAVDERKARAVELHYFGGMSQDEVAAALGVHRNTVVRDLRLAEAWLNRHLCAV
jgi:RNA polymerase sigma factor (TIGR02999 family)